MIVFKIQTKVIKKIVKNSFNLTWDFNQIDFNQFIE